MSSDTVINILAIVIPLFEVIGIITAVHAIMNARTSQGAIAWAISLVTFPFLALPLYWIFGRGKFQGYRLLRNSKDREVRHIMDILSREAREQDLLSDNQKGEFRALAELASMPFIRGNSARLLVDGQVTFDSIFEGISAARTYVLVQFFIIKDDNLGGRLKSALIQKATEGVGVYLLYDEIGCHKLPKSYAADLRKAGVTVHAFHTTKGRANHFQINFRNHRKIVVVDGEVGYVGGHNVGDEYLGKSLKFKAWRDTHVEIRGPVVQAVQFSFLEDWYWASSSIPELNWKLTPDGRKNILSQVVATGPADQLDSCGLLFVHAIQSARRRIWIASPYFVPDAPVISALQLAALRGVDVRILVPDKPDHLLVYWASYSYYEKVLPLGIKLYRYQAGFMHQKTMLVDDDLSAVGTANFDNRSFRLNFEITMLFKDREIAGEVERMFEKDFACSRQATMADFQQRPFLFRLAARSSSLLSPIL